MPVGAFGGKRDIMQQLSPAGPVYQAGTLSGNPVAMSAGLAALKLMSQPGYYDSIYQYTQQLVSGMQSLADEAGMPFTTNHVGSMFGVFFTDDKTVNSYQQVASGDHSRFGKFFHLLLDQGVYLAPSAFEAGFVSKAHGSEQLDKTLTAVKQAFANL